MKQLKFNQYFKFNNITSDAVTGKISGYGAVNNTLNEEIYFDDGVVWDFGYNGYPTYFYKEHLPVHSFANTKNKKLILEKVSGGIKLDLFLNLENSQSKDLFLDFKDGNILGFSAGIVPTDYEIDENNKLKVKRASVMEISATHQPANLDTGNQIDIQQFSKQFNKTKNKQKYDLDIAIEAMSKRNKE